jgi:hypothetical protein
MYYLVSFQKEKEFPVIIYANKPIEAKRVYFPFISNLLNRKDIDEMDINVEYSQFYNQGVLVRSLI